MTLSIFLTFFSSLFAIPDTSIHTTVEAQAIVSDAGVTPFWMRSLQYGSVPMENPGLVLRAWNGKGYNLKKKYDWKYEVEATGWTGKQNDFWLTQAYVSGRRGKWELWAGRRKEVYGLGDTTMTSGFYAWSGNAVPMPKIQLGTRDYLNFAKGWLGVHMTYSHGWFDNQGPTINAYLHQKTLYGRIGKPDSFINVFGGLNHQVSWGGESKSKGYGFDYYPSSLNAYFYVITLLKDRSIVKIDTNTSWDDANNQYGNHLGSIDLGIKFQWKWGNIFIYKQTAYETGRIASLVTATDGLTGVSINLKKGRLVKKIVLEQLFTANQGIYKSAISNLLKLKDPHYPEFENYFNNGNRGGWVYMNKGIGTPLIVIDSESQLGGFQSFRYNAVNALYLSIEGTIVEKTYYNLKISLSKHGYIENGDNFPISRYIKSVKQFSFNGKLSRPLNNKISLGAEIGYDNGKQIENTMALMISAKLNIN